MCKDCGCSSANQSTEMSHAHEHAHSHSHSHGHDHDHQSGHQHSHVHEADPTESRTLSVERSLLEMNEHLAWHNRELFSRNGVYVVNMMSSPGAGKTRLLERTLDDLSAKLRMAVIVGDLQTDNDARRLRDRGAPVVPVTTGTMCHLEADLVARACEEIDFKALDLVFIENVGNLVCPAAFDLGEAARVVLMSVTEGEDKPLKYPPMFKRADVVLATKIDMADAADFNLGTALQNIHNIAPQAKVIQVSARTGEGLSEWYNFLADGVKHQTSMTEQLASL